MLYTQPIYNMEDYQVYYYHHVIFNLNSLFNIHACSKTSLYINLTTVFILFKLFLYYTHSTQNTVSTHSTQTQFKLKIEVEAKI